MENDYDAMTELDFRRWIMRNFCELKEHILNQGKETKNLEKRFEKRFKEVITRMDNLERNMNELKELKTQYENFAKHAQVSIAELTKQKKEYLKSKTNSMK